MRLLLAGMACSLMFSPLALGAETAAAPAKASGSEGGPSLAQKSQNPVADMISVPFQYNLNFGVGPDNDEQSILNIQPVYPMKLTESWNLIHRTIIPVVDQPDPVNKSGLSDIQYQGYLTPAKPKGLIWGIGPVVTMPTASDDKLGTEKWSAGPGLVVLKIEGPWVVGGVANNTMSFAGDDDRASVNQFFAQYFINYNWPDFYFSSGPAITANWQADGGDQWTVPFGGGFGKIFKPKRLPPLNAKFGAYYNVEKPHDAADWQLQIQVAVLFPK